MSTQKRKGPLGNEAVRIVRGKYASARCVAALDFRSYQIRADGGVLLGTAHTSIDAWANAACNVLATS